MLLFRIFNIFKWLGLHLVQSIAKINIVRITFQTSQSLGKYSLWKKLLTIFSLGFERVTNAKFKFVSYVQNFNF